jgi:acetolactate decarboxylase
MKSLLVFWAVFAVLTTSLSAQMPIVRFVGSMSEMGALNFAPHIQLDTITDKAHLFGIGPLGRMQGEITILDGKPLGASVGSDGNGIVRVGWKMEAPFFVFAQVEQWQTFRFDIDTRNLNDIQKAVADIAVKNGYDISVPFPFRLVGKIAELTTHIVMPRSEEIQGFQPNKKQADFMSRNQEGELVGFYSERHQGVYTSKDSFIHVHFVSQDHTIMGHVDKIQTDKASLTLYLPKKSGGQYPKVIPKGMGNLAPINVNDTDFSKGRLGHQQTITIQDLIAFHGHLCDGLVEGFIALQHGLYALYPDSLIDRTNTRVVSKPSPCLTDAAVYLTGGRYQFHSFYASDNIKGLFILQRIDNEKTVVVTRKAGVKPVIIDEMGKKAIRGELSACELDELKHHEDMYTEKLLQTQPQKILDVQEISNFVWQPETKNDFLKTDIINKYKSACR